MLWIDVMIFMMCALARMEIQNTVRYRTSIRRHYRYRNQWFAVNDKIKFNSLGARGLGRLAGCDCASLLQRDCLRFQYQRLFLCFCSNVYHVTQNWMCIYRCRFYWCSQLFRCLIIHCLDARIRKDTDTHACKLFRIIISSVTVSPFL